VITSGVDGILTPRELAMHYVDSTRTRVFARNLEQPRKNEAASSCPSAAHDICSPMYREILKQH